jgi:hypothetical protein
MQGELTTEAIEQFKSQGFCVVRQLIPEFGQRFGSVEAFDATLASAYGQPGQSEQAPEPPSRLQIWPFFHYNPTLYHALLDDPRLGRLLEGLLGTGPCLTAIEGIHFRGQPTSWHHDDVGPEGFTHLKVVFALEPTSVATGCLYLLPGSHTASQRASLEAAPEALAQGAALPGAVPIEAAVGDAVVFNIKAYHSAWGDGRTHRRGVYMNFQQRPTTAEEKAYMHKLYARDGKHLGLPGLGGPNLYYPSLFDEAVSANSNISSARLPRASKQPHFSSPVAQSCGSVVCPCVLRPLNSV